MRPWVKIGLMFFVFGVISSCREKETTLFTRISSGDSGIDFNNALVENDPDFSILTYPYFYNGGGVAIGDINNDGLEDIVFTGNMVKNSLYLNKGELKFEDISKKSGIGLTNGWSTGVTMADVNEDGWLDIYICRSGPHKIQDRTNLLFINNHDLTFSEKSAQYGLNHAGYSTQASFFDYDGDGDLDLFLINQSSPEFARGFLDYIQNRNRAADSTLSNALFRNEQGHFENVSAEAGIHSNIFTFSLGVSTADINQDGFPDIYVSNDFEEPDYLYLNNQHGGFAFSLSQSFDHTSLYGMGIDIADYNNDHLPDLVQLDMLPEGDEAKKMHIGGDNFNRYNSQFQNGMGYQYMKNSLQKNNGDGTFSEIGELAGISNTDWSWSPLLADLDNDGRKDLFVTNGYKRDNTNMQFMAYAYDQSMKNKTTKPTPADVQEYISQMPGINIPNYVFRNEGNDHFQNKIKEWGFNQNTFSHGAAFADLDHDGDLDLITNNTDGEAGVYRNNSEMQSGNHFITIQLQGSDKNNKGIGSKIFAYAGDDQYYLEQSTVRGYQSSIGHDLHFGLGKHRIIDSLRIVWPDQTTQLLRSVKVDTVLILTIPDVAVHSPSNDETIPLLKEVKTIDFWHVENFENDFNKQYLLPHFISHNGPCMISGDVNGDGLADVFVGGAKDQPAALFMGSKDGWVRSDILAIQADSASEDMDAAFFDADGDKDLDLYVVSGGYEFADGSPLLQDRLYYNNGRGKFIKAANKLVMNRHNKKIVRPVDFDGDGDMDLFIGGGVVPGNFPYAATSSLYFNDGKGDFTTSKPGNAALGMVNDALWMDLDGDDKKDLIIASDWMPLRAFVTKGALFNDVSAQWFPWSSSGLWNCLASGDFDHDGDIDLVAGNFGWNTPLKENDIHPLQLYYPDLDGNGSTDPLLFQFTENHYVPFVMRDDIVGQIPVLKKKFDYAHYATAGMDQILSPEQLSKSPVLTAGVLETVYLENTGKQFVRRSLPIEAQYSAVNVISVSDLNHDGQLDLILAGNQHYNRIIIGRQDANHGMVLLGDGTGNFKYLSQENSGLKIKEDVRSILTTGDEVLFGINNRWVRGYRVARVLK